MSPDPRPAAANFEERMDRSQPSIGILTCSYRGDAEACRLLCRTIDRFAPWVEHRLIVPRKDLPLFLPLRGPRREVIAQEELQPGWLMQMPMPPPRWRRLLHLPRREMFLSLRGLPVRGWILQQMLKIAAVRDAAWDVVLHVDSDCVFFRELTREHLVQDGRVRFYRSPGAADMEPHRTWHRAAATLLGLPPQDYFGADYIDSFVVWQKTIVRGLTDRIESVSGRDWWTTLSRTLHFAEYILYGVYADRVMTEDPGHFATARSLGLSRWSEGFSDAAAETAFLASMGADQVACNIQSTLGLSAADRERLLGDLIAYAAAQGEAGA